MDDNNDESIENPINDIEKVSSLFIIIFIK